MALYTVRLIIREKRPGGETLETTRTVDYATIIDAWRPLANILKTMPAPVDDPAEN